MEPRYRYDAFLSYRHEEPDSDFAWDLVERLEAAGYTVAIDERDFQANVPFLKEMERCIRESRFTLAVASPRYLDSDNCEEEGIISTVLDLSERKRRLVPLSIEKVQLPAWLYILTGLDFTNPKPRVDPFEKLKRTLGPPLHPPTPPEPDPYRGHPRVAEIFAGRERELEDIERSLLGAGGARPVAICALQGMGGVGKSYLADRFCHLHASAFPGGYERVVLDPAGPVAETEKLLGELADRLKVYPASLRDRLLEPRTLLHIENVDSQPLARTTVELVDRLRGCLVVVTGRYQGLGETAGWGRVEIRPFTPADALDLLRQELGDEAREGPDAYRRLAESLGYLPLAIHLAAGHLRAGHTVGGFLERLQATGLQLAPADEADPAHAARGRAILQSTFSLSLDLLRDHLATAGMDADRLLAGLHALAQAPASGFGASLGAALADLSPAEFEELRVTARKLSLLEPVPAAERSDQAWRIHSLLAQLLRTRAGEEESSKAFDRMTDWFVSRLPKLPTGQEDEMGRLWKEVQAETEALTAWLARVPEADRVKVERAGSKFAIAVGPFHTWGAFCEEMLAGPLTDTERSNALWTLCQISLRSGALDRSLAAATEKRDLDQERGDERASALASGAITDILEARGDLDEALRIRQQELLPIFEKLGDVGTRAVTLGKIADILEARGDLDEALRIRQQEQIPVYEKIGDIRARAVALGRIADILEARGDLDEALRIKQQEEIPVYERLAATHFLLRGRTNLAKIHLQRGQEGDREAALKLLHLALEAAERMRIPEVDWIRSILQKHGLSED